MPTAASMWAARIHQWDAPPVVEEVPVPQPGSDEVLVQMQSAALSHLDLTVASGTFGIRPDLPYIGGVEGAGVVLEGGGLPPGTQVLLRGAGVGLQRDGTWAEYVAAPAEAVTPLPHPLRPEIAATFFQPTSTAYVVLHDVARLRADDRVIVVGAAGAVGAQVVQQALMAGAAVVGVVGRADQAADIPDGAERAVLGDDLQLRLGEERSATLLVDTLGGDGLAQRLTWVAAGGRAVVVGYVVGTSVTLDLPAWLLSDVSILPVNMIRNQRRAKEVSPVLVEHLIQGELTVAVDRFDLEQVAEGLTRLRGGRVRGRAAISFASA